MPEAFALTNIRLCDRWGCAAWVVVLLNENLKVEVKEEEEEDRGKAPKVWL